VEGHECHLPEGPEMAVCGRSWKTIQLCTCSIFVGCKITWQFDGNRQVKFVMKVHDQHCYMSHGLLYVAEQLQVCSMSVI
jgi:hypothetical protein